ncbi:MAG: hypothetical protein R3C14_28030 [Caldilineaceae bacterium]
MKIAWKVGGQREAVGLRVAEAAQQAGAKRVKKKGSSDALLLTRILV